MEEDDLLAEDELREKLRQDQEQKRRIQEDHKGVLHRPGNFQPPFGSDKSRFYSKIFGVLDRETSDQYKGWNEETRGRDNMVRDGGFNRGFQEEGILGVDFWLGDGLFDRTRSDPNGRIQG